MSYEQLNAFDKFLKSHSKPHPSLAVKLPKVETAHERYERRKNHEKKRKTIHPASVMLCATWVQLYAEYLTAVDPQLHSK